MAAGHGNNQPKGQLSEMLQYLALYTYGLLKSPLLSPITQNPHSSPYLDIVANLKFAVNSMSPEEVVPIFHPQIYSIADPNLVDTEFP
jgi:hypothetical protein